jgi:hypothetical protein
MTSLLGFFLILHDGGVAHSHATALRHIGCLSDNDRYWFPAVVWIARYRYHRIDNAFF